ncbi:MAG: hypothetical protein PHS37_04155 [Candidatus Omnitrophica bacterium]|nr:hypothetical protein [Candidatus Omnitrophota bacterium]
MKDKTLEHNIKETQVFVEFWTKFHELYKQTVAQNPVPVGKTNLFVLTKDLVSSRFDDLMDQLEIRSAERMVKCMPIYEILSLNDFSTMSDEKLTHLTDCWTESYYYLYGLLSRFKKKRKRIEKFNRFFFVAKKLLAQGVGR